MGPVNIWGFLWPFMDAPVPCFLFSLVAEFLSSYVFSKFYNALGWLLITSVLFSPWWHYSPRLWFSLAHRSSSVFCTHSCVPVFVLYPVLWSTHKEPDAKWWQLCVWHLGHQWYPLASWGILRWDFPVVVGWLPVNLQWSQLEPCPSHVLWYFLFVSCPISSLPPVRKLSLLYSRREMDFFSIIAYSWGSQTFTHHSLLFPAEMIPGLLFL